MYNLTRLIHFNAYKWLVCCEVSLRNDVHDACFTWWSLQVRVWAEDISLLYDIPQVIFINYLWQFSQSEGKKLDQIMTK